MVNRTPEEILQAIEEAALDDEMERVLAMTPEERRRELEAAGVDLDEVNAAADAIHERMRGAAEPRPEVQPAAEAPVVPITRTRRSPRAPWLAAAAAIALLVGALGVTEGGAIVAWLKGTPEPILPDNAAPRPLTPRELAERSRDEADQACADELWGRCREKLDEATKLDPAGDAEERVQRMRATIRDRTTLKPGPSDKRWKK